MIPENIIRITSTVIISTVFLGLSGPVFGELISTTAPFFGKGADRSAVALNLNYENVAFKTTDDITLRGWFFPSKNVNAPAVLYAPSTANDQRSGLSLVNPLHEAGFNVLLFSYRGSGRSQGNPIGFTYGANESKDVDAAVDFLHNVKKIHSIAAIGHSAGAVAIILSAARNPEIDVVVAASPFASIEEIWMTNRPSWIPIPIFNFMMQVSEWRKGFQRDEVRPIDVIENIAPRPILIIQGMADRRITQDQAAILFSRAQDPKSIWYMGSLSHAEVRTIGIDDHIWEIVNFINNGLGLSLVQAGIL